MTNAFNEIFDGASAPTQTMTGTPRRKRGAATCQPQTVSAPPPLINSVSVETPKRRKATRGPQTTLPSPSADLIPIPRKRGRPAKILAKPERCPPGVNNTDGLTNGENLARAAIGSGRVDLHSDETLGCVVNAALSHIVAGWKMRQRWHKAEKSLILQAKAICRAFCAGDKDKANAAYDDTLDGNPPAPEFVAALSPFCLALDGFEQERKAIEKNLKKTAKNLPTYDWAMSVRGFGELNFVAIIGECCVMEEDGSMRGIGDYRSVSALWKRMGVGLVNGERQRRIADAELAILHGYNPSRRSVLFNVGECLIKSGGEYKELYNERKAYELARDPEIRPIIAHRRSSRYMTKRLLRKMFAQWRKETRGASGDPDEITLPIAAE